MLVQNHMEDFFYNTFAPPPKFLLQWAWGAAQEFTFLTSSQAAMLVQLIQTARFAF